MMKAIRNHLYLLFNALFLGGIILIGTQVLLFVSWIDAILFSVAVFLVYLSLVYGAHKLVTSRTVGTFLRKRYKETTLAFTAAAIIALIPTFATIPFALLVEKLAAVTASSPKYYFYATVFSLITFVTTELHFYGLGNERRNGLEALKATHALQLELLRTLLWAFAFIIFGTAYAQILTGASISSGEMILVLYGFIGVIGFVLVPAAQMWFATLDEIREHERKNNACA
jgi:hypothetical protein